MKTENRKVATCFFYFMCLLFVSRRFQEGRALSGEQAAREYQEGLKNLEMLKRQVLISHLYPSKRSVMEPEARKAPTLG